MVPLFQSVLYVTSAMTWPEGDVCTSSAPSVPTSSSAVGVVSCSKKARYKVHICIDALQTWNVNNMHTMKL